LPKREKRRPCLRGGKRAAVQPISQGKKSGAGVGQKKLACRPLGKRVVLSLQHEKRRRVSNECEEGRSKNGPPGRCDECEKQGLSEWREKKKGGKGGKNRAASGKKKKVKKEIRTEGYGWL